MENKPVTDRDLEEAEECRLVEPDGTSWKVLHVTVENGLTWVRAQRPAEMPHGSESGETGELPPGRRRVFDTVLSPKARLVWKLPDGRDVEARGAADGELVWDVRSRPDPATRDPGAGPGDPDRDAPDEDRSGGDGEGLVRDAIVGR